MPVFGKKEGDTDQVMRTLMQSIRGRLKIDSGPPALDDLVRETAGYVLAWALVGGQVFGQPLTKLGAQLGLTPGPVPRSRPSLGPFRPALPGQKLHKIPREPRQRPSELSAITKTFPKLRALGER